jgi:hypothetical protein
MLFLPRWRQGVSYPSILTKFTTRGWRSISSLKGMFDHVDTVAKQLGLPSISLFGLPISLTLGEQVSPGKGQKYPVVTAAIDGDLIEFLMNQRQRIESIGGKNYLALTDDTLADPHVIAADIDDIMPGEYKPRGVE